jgi:succinate dehydrogenase/fumarate reductase-like Fe-S protein
VASSRALVYLGYRALLAHPLKRFFRQQGTGLERFTASYIAEGLVPTRPEDRAAGEAASSCISCGLCEPGCALAGASPEIRALGLHAAFRLYSRASASLPLAREALQACAGCAGCEALCPTGVPISRVIAYLGQASTRSVSAGPGPAWYPPAP